MLCKNQSIFNNIEILLWCFGYGIAQNFSIMTFFFEEITFIIGFYTIMQIVGFSYIQEFF